MAHPARAEGPKGDSTIPQTSSANTRVTTMLRAKRNRETSDEPFSGPCAATVCGYCRLTWRLACEVCLDTAHPCRNFPKRLCQRISALEDSAVRAALRRRRRVDRVGPLELA